MFKNYQKERCYIIAEIGGNFTSFEEAKQLINAAYECGVDAVKLQTYRAETITSANAFFDMENTGVVSQYALFKKYEVDESLHRSIFAYIESKGLDWFSTPSHESDVDLLEKFGVGAHKIGSDDAVNIPYLRYVARTGKPIILSTGMCTMEEVRESVSAILEEGNDRLMLLHAITSYPTHPQNVNLLSIRSMMRAFPGLDIGYSDHTVTPIASLCAAALGARIIEKHFTLDKSSAGPDHMLSADPTEMKWLVDSIRCFELMRGSGVKRPADSEKNTRINNRKSLILKGDIKKGDRLTASNIAIKRPGYGISPKYFNQVIGRSVMKDMESDSILTWADLT